jgi:hypothetical protein
MVAIQQMPLALPPRRFFKETDHNGWAVVRHCLQGHEEGGSGADIGFIDREQLGFLQVIRAHRGYAKAGICDEGDVIIIVNAAKGEALRSGDWEDFESLLVPAATKWMWKICWSVARRLAGAHPGRPALIADGEWNAFEHVELSPFHNRSIAYASPMPRQQTTNGALAGTGAL